MLPIIIKFQAFIPKSLGKPLLSYFQNSEHFNSLTNKEEFVRKIRNIDSKGFTWLPEPGNSFSNKYYATDSVEMYHHHSEHSTRLAIEMIIEPKKIGNYNFYNEIFKHPEHKKGKGNPFNQHSGESHQVCAYIKKVPELVDTGTTFIQTGHHYVGVCSNTISHDRSDELPLNVDIQNSLSGTYFHESGTVLNNDTTTIKVSASAGYPFAEPFSPNIDFELEFILYKNLANKSLSISVKGFHNNFPAYELIVNRNVAYSHNPSHYGHAGPGLINLNTRKYFNVNNCSL
ncbi:hypothetical protein [Tenacibaculum larymnensis]|uniref:DUF3238 domain-containing protein n=1 Tax=Tenacibaculum larymnensis TaxID=2878201 RepID=A0A9X4EQL5_9FLAO|nr:hypothetical protein [Tenacibaculum larymnensis]MDE1206855.1 DUF3238 domain-containing protein [Tenacibaculum larymnensis]